MKKYRVYFAEIKKEYLYMDIEEENGESAMRKINSGRSIHIPAYEDEKMEPECFREAEEYEELVS